MPLPRLTRVHHEVILMHMRTTLNIDDSLLNNAAKLTGVKEKTSLVRLGLEALIAKESARRLANLGGPRNVFARFEEGGLARAHDSSRYFGMDRASASRKRSS